MTFRYFVIFSHEEPDRPQGLMAVNRDKEASRLDTIAYSHMRKRWESNPEVVGRFLFGEDYYDEREEVSRYRAEEVAGMIGTVLPSEEEMMRISDEAEREREARHRRFRIGEARRRNRRRPR